LAFEASSENQEHDDAAKQLFRSVSMGNLGATIGGSILNLTGNNYQLLGVTLGAFGVATAKDRAFASKRTNKMQPQT
jgi:hypothetical protein